MIVNLLAAPTDDKLNTAVRSKPKTTQMLLSGVLRESTPHRDARRLSVVSMFSGCGGMDLGFKGGFSIFGQEYSQLPFEIVWANEINAAACRSYRKNIDSNIFCGNVWDYLECLPDYADVVIGGFPCQDVSINGKGAGLRGKRTSLYAAMVEAVKCSGPSILHTQ